MFNFFPDLNIFLTHYIAKVKMQRKKGEKLDERNFCIMKMHPICVSSKKLFLWGKSRIKVAKQNKQVFLDVFLPLNDYIYFSFFRCGSASDRRWWIKQFLYLVKLFKVYQIIAESHRVCIHLACLAMKWAMKSRQN